MHEIIYRQVYSISSLIPETLENVLCKSYLYFYRVRVKIVIKDD